MNLAQFENCLAADAVLCENQMQNVVGGVNPLGFIVEFLRDTAIAIAVNIVVKKTTGKGLEEHAEDLVDKTIETVKDVTTSHGDIVANNPLAFIY